MLTTSRSGCFGSGLLLRFFAASWLESFPAFGFCPLVPRRCSCPTQANVQSPVRPRGRHRSPLTGERPTSCFLFSAAARAASRVSALGGVLSFLPAPLPPGGRTVPTTVCPPSNIVGFEQSPPIRAGDQGKKVNVDPSHRSPPMIHRVLPQVSPRLRAFYVLAGDRYEVYNTCNSPYKSCSVSAEKTPAKHCTHPAYCHHLDARKDFAPQDQTLPNVCAVSVPATAVSPKNGRLGRKSQHTSHNSLPAVQLNRGSSPAFSIFPLIPAPSNNPKTVSRNRVTTSWSRGESLSYRKKPRQSTTPSEQGREQEHSRKQRASTSPSLPVAVSGSASPKVAPAHIGRFWFRHHCFVQDRQGLFGLSGKFRCRIV